MTPLPKRRWSTRRQGKRRATHTAGLQTRIKCSQCGELKTSHSVCPMCGFYRGKKIIEVKTKVKQVEKTQ